MSRLFWNEGGAYVLHAETPDPPVPALGRVNLEHDAPVPRQRYDFVTSQNQHRITIAIEPIAMSNCLFVDGEDLVAARKRRREDQQRRLRQMEVGEESGDQLEAVTRVDEQAGLAVASPHDSILHVQ